MHPGGRLATCLVRIGNERKDLPCARNIREFTVAAECMTKKITDNNARIGNELVLACQGVWLNATESRGVRCCSWH